MTDSNGSPIQPDLNQDQQHSSVETSEPIDTESLTRSAGRGALWNVIGSFYQIVIQVGARVVLARILFPEDYGIVGMAVLAQGLISRIGILGTSAGVIAKKDVTQDDLSTAFWISVTIQGFLFAVLFTFAPMIVRFFSSEGMDPELFYRNLTWIIRLFSVTFLLTAIGSVSSTLLSKRLRFGTQAIIHCGGFTIQVGSAIVFAVVFRWGFWSLILSQLINNFVTTAASIICASWLPSFRFNRSSFHFLIRYGIYGLGSSILDYFRHNTDYLLVGRMLGAGQLGIYEFAYRIPHMVINKLASTLRGVLFPTLAKMQQDNQRLAAGYIKVARYLALIVFPLLGGLAATARPTVLLLFSERWAAVIVPLQILCFRAAIQCILTPVGTLFLCKNRPDIPFKFGLCSLGFTFAAVLGFGYFFGLNGVALGMLVSVAPTLVLLGLAFHMTETRLRKLLRALIPAIFAATFSSALAWGTVQFMEWYDGRTVVVFFCSVTAGVLGYLGIISTVFRSTLQEIKETIRIVLGRNK
jgi:lipopolysaccharide exporter